MKIKQNKTTAEVRDFTGVKSKDDLEDKLHFQDSN